MYQWLFLREFASISVATSVTSAILCKKKYRVGEEIDFVFFCSCIQESVKMICAEMKSIDRENKYPPNFVLCGIYGTYGNPVLRDGQIFDALNLGKQMLFGSVSLSHLDGVPPNLYCCRIHDAYGKTDKIKYRTKAERRTFREIGMCSFDNADQCVPAHS